MAPVPVEAPEKQDSGTPVPVQKKLSNGIILGPDGKPCRTCNDVASLFAFSGKKKPTAVAAAPTTTPALPTDCPPDVEALGRSSWTLLHSITATYPVNPTPALQSETSSFLSTFGKLYPCWVCAEDFQSWMAQNTPRVSSRSEFGTWMCEAHNAVNTKLGKKTFDCARWEERWRTGWKDGRCDI
ncbi:mitochondrial FAD-linked sulfhydryl oxidase-like protein ERV1 [Pyrenochaeta sp. DS3sAY3a]|nr:mitochondrial FAD-linked sulfhydryl oxidase-like protein ERV1 [Pyrenochaeta sp. DS3sAY3a]